MSEFPKHQPRENLNKAQLVQDILEPSLSNEGKKPTEFEDIPENGLGDPDKFMAALTARAEGATLEGVSMLLSNLEKYAQAKNLRIEVYTDPDLDTFCCAEVPSKKIDKNGEILEDAERKTYIIGVPYIFAAGGAPTGFMRGEILHERGHAEWTNFKMLSRLRNLAIQDGFPPETMQALVNCIEDPRMERVQGGPRFLFERKQLFEKNRRFIIPNIAQGLRQGGMSRAEQLNFFLKIERLWELHRGDLAGTPKPWDDSVLDSDVFVAHQRMSEVIALITGSASRPGLMLSDDIERAIATQIWPEYKKLLEEDRKNPKPQENSSKSKSGKSKAGPEGDGEKKPGDIEGDMDPTDTDNWPEPHRSIIKKLTKQHIERLEKNAQAVKKRKEDIDRRSESIRQEMHQILKNRDKFETPEAREEYNVLCAEVRPTIARLKRIFENTLPKVEDPEHEWSRRGWKFSVKRLSRQYGSGKENPLGKKENPEEVALALQVIIDVSGSMYDHLPNGRIASAVKTAIAICEAAEDTGVQTEILVSDEKNVSSDTRYLIKDFSEEYDGRAKARVAGVLKNFGDKGNEDADSIDAALPRVKARTAELSASADRVGALTIFITDSTTQSKETKESANKFRQHSPLEGTAITPEGEIPSLVKYHFGEESIIPRSVEGVPDAFQKILRRHLSYLTPRA